MDKNFLESLKTGYIDKSIESDISIVPEIITNDFNKPQKVLTSIINSLSTCDYFFFNVAFLTKSGVIALFNTLEEIQKLGIEGKILISSYQNFTQPDGLRLLKKFSNLELRLIDKDNFHGKGYIFKKKDSYELIIGSSNITQDALSKNSEYNLKIYAKSQSKILEETMSLFEKNFFKGIPLTDQTIDEYEQSYLENIKPKAKAILKEEDDQVNYNPNEMQKLALENIKNLRSSNQNKALLISATATGKTFLSAFDVEEMKVEKVLFIVHRLNIAKKSLKTFKHVFKNNKTYGIFSGSEKNINADFIFSTNLTISNPDNFKKFKPNHFDYIIIDEAHRSGAETYKKIINYFTPKFLLGMTATPERTDAFDIFTLFDHNIAYEIRLKKAMEMELVVPFHYFGVTDIQVNGQILDENSDFRLLTSDERVDRVIEYANKYGCDDGNIRGLVFCSKVNEANELSNKFNQRGYKTISLSGANTEIERENAIDKIESDNLDEKIDYIFTVDIFNEGIDIPRINQVIMLRPTQSNIIFVQQLGRGLRKYFDQKEYVTVIDFIGNYQNNFLIPVALFGDTSYNKDNLRKMLNSGSSVLPGSSTINFDKISKERIFESISNTNLQKKNELAQDYKLLKLRLGRIPKMMDFLVYESRDPFQFVEYSKSYLNFVNMIESDIYKIKDEEKKILETYNQYLNNGTSIEDVLILKKVIEFGVLKLDDLKSILIEDYAVKEINVNQINNILNLNYFTERVKGKNIQIGSFYNYDLIQFNNNFFSLGKNLKKCLENKIFKNFLNDSINYSIKQFNNKFQKTDFVINFFRYEKYSRRDIHRILGWNKIPNAQNVGGYEISKNGNVCPIFVTYKKKKDIADTMNYEDKFLSPGLFEWFSKSNRSISSPDVVAITNIDNPIRLPFFLKKDDNEGAEFYYIGEFKVIHDSVIDTKMLDKEKNKEVSVVKIHMDIDKPVRQDLYDYIIK